MIIRKALRTHMITDEQMILTTLQGTKASILRRIPQNALVIQKPFTLS